MRSQLCVPMTAMRVQITEIKLNQLSLKQHPNTYTHNRTLLTSPSTALAGTRQSSKNSSQVSWAFMPSFFSLLPLLKPLVLVSTKNSVMPLAPCSAEKTEKTETQTIGKLTRQKSLNGGLLNRKVETICIFPVIELQNTPWWGLSWRRQSPHHSASRW